MTPTAPTTAPSPSVVSDHVHERILQEGIEPGRDAVRELVRDRVPLADDDVVERIVDGVLARVSGLGVLEPVMADPSVTDVMVDGTGTVWVDGARGLQLAPVRIDPADVVRLVERVVAPLGLRADRITPLVDARLADGSRVNVAMPPLAVDGPYVTIRRFRTEHVPLDGFADPAVVEVLTEAVRTRRNIIVVGGTGAGKTTLLNALCHHLDPGERVVTIEDAAELRLPGDHVVRLESRPATADGLAAVTIRDLVRNALRMRPDRIVVGEVRGGEALDMLQAMNTGHDGSLSTCHANGPAQALRRLETLALSAGVDLPLRAVRDQVCGAIDLVVHVVRDADGRRVVHAVDTVTDDPDDPVRTRPVVRSGRVVEGGR